MRPNQGFHVKGVYVGEGSWSPMEPSKNLLSQISQLPVMLSMTCHANLHAPFLYLEGEHEDPECPYILAL